MKRPGALPAADSGPREQQQLSLVPLDNRALANLVGPLETDAVVIASGRIEVRRYERRFLHG